MDFSKKERKALRNAVIKLESYSRMQILSFPLAKEFLQSNVLDANIPASHIPIFVNNMSESEWGLCSSRPFYERFSLIDTYSEMIHTVISQSAISPFLSVEKVASLFDVTSQMVFAWIRRGIIPAIRIGSQYRIQSSDINMFINQSKAGVYDSEESKTSDNIADNAGNTPHNQPYSKPIVIQKHQESPTTKPVHKPQQQQNPQKSRQDKASNSSQIKIIDKNNEMKENLPVNDTPMKEKSVKNTTPPEENPKSQTTESKENNTSEPQKNDKKPKKKDKKHGNNQSQENSTEDKKPDIKGETEKKRTPDANNGEVKADFQQEKGKDNTKKKGTDSGDKANTEMSITPDQKKPSKKTTLALKVNTLNEKKNLGDRKSLGKPKKERDKLIESQKQVDSIEEEQQDDIEVLEPSNTPELSHEAESTNPADTNNDVSDTPDEQESTENDGDFDSIEVNNEPEEESDGNANELNLNNMTWDEMFALAEKAEASSRESEPEEKSEFEKKSEPSNDTSEPVPENNKDDTNKTTDGDVNPDSISDFEEIPSSGIDEYANDEYMTDITENHETPQEDEPEDEYSHSSDNSMDKKENPSNPPIAEGLPSDEKTERDATESPLQNINRKSRQAEDISKEPISEHEKGRKKILIKKPSST